MCATGGHRPSLPRARPPQVLGHCPSPGLAPAVQSPLLLPEALQLLEETLGDEDYGGVPAPTAVERVPAYTPVFSDGWLPPVMEQERRGSLQDTPARASVSPAQSRPSPSLRPAQAAGTVSPCPCPAEGRGRLWALMQPLPTPRSALPAQGLVRALYDFQARNSQELSVRKGDTLQVLDQQRKWWLVQDERGDRGHVPGNILEPLPEPGHSSRQVGDPSALPSPRPHQDGVAGGTAMSPPNVPSRCPPLQDSPPTLHPSSSPAEVTAWLMDKGFSRITVRTLGVLRGHELLQMSPAELRGVCPEEWRRVLFKLSPIRTSLGEDKGKKGVRTRGTGPRAGRRTQHFTPPAAPKARPGAHPGQPMAARGPRAQGCPQPSPLSALRGWQGTKAPSPRPLSGLPH
uniref:Uncharacterized protein n=1 Tax=Geospiza parvula TaxID=87175 RepID=A0A8U8BF15_GEOPR